MTSSGRLGGASALVLLCSLALIAAGAAPVELARQSITLPTNAGAPLFVDVDGDGLCDLLVIDQVEKRLFYFRQHQLGFTNSPDQVISLPRQAAWVGLCDGLPACALVAQLPEPRAFTCLATRTCHVSSLSRLERFTLG